MKKCNIMVFVIATLFSVWTLAQPEELLTINREGTSKQTSAVDAAREITSELTAEVARAQIFELLGDKAFAKHKGTIEGKVLRESGRYFPFVNPSAIKQLADGSWVMQIEFKLSLLSLRKVLQAAGINSNEQGPTAIYAFLRVEDRAEDRHHDWWVDENEPGVTSEVSGLAHEFLKQEFARQGIFVAAPNLAIALHLPENLRVARFNKEETRILGEKLQSPLLIFGDIKWGDATKGQIRARVVQARDGRLVAEMNRRFDFTEPAAAIVARIKPLLQEMARELAAQTGDAWQKGVVGATLVRLDVKGNLGPKRAAELKNALIRDVRDIRAVHERMFSSQMTVFEVATQRSSEVLAEKIKDMKFPDFTLSLQDSSELSLRYEVRLRQ